MRAIFLVFCVFRGQVDENAVKKVLEFIFISARVIKDKQMNRFRENNEIFLPDIERIISELKDFMDLLKYGIYKKEENS